MESNTVRYSLDYKYKTVENTLAYKLKLINYSCTIFHSTGVTLERLARDKWCSFLISDKVKDFNEVDTWAQCYKTFSDVIYQCLR